ncbi:hypothetical protein [Kordia jejudonensis]|uniref:hypothetical protein n=1 Tax=Kordia jejudonensis TaxID=1348245 RepID=UPI00062972CC|nr:hypothetical protein [Kordia jejudonensis]
MNSYQNTSKKNEHQSVANALSTHQQATATPFQLKDNRPKSVIQQKLQNASQGVVQLKKYYRWTQKGTVIECNEKSYKRSKRKATEADYFKHNPKMQAEMQPKVSRTYETAPDAAANAGLLVGGARQRSQSIHVPTRNRSGSFDIRHTHDNINSAVPAHDESVGHIDRTGVRTGRPARVDSRATSPNEITKPEAGELTAEEQAEIYN